MKKIIYIVVFVCLFFNTASIAKSLNDVRSEKSVKEKELKEFKEKEEQLEKKKNDKDNQLYELTNEIVKIDNAISELELKIDEIDKKYEEHLDLFKKRIVVMYQNTNTTYFEILIEANGIEDFFQKLNLISHVTQRDQLLLDELESIKLESSNIKETKLELKKIKESSAEKTKFDINEIKSSKESLDNEISKRNKEIEILNNLEQNIINESKKVQKFINDKSSKKKSSKKKSNVKGSNNWPVPSYNYISSGFGWRKHPISGRKSMHTGIDVAANRGNSIVSFNKGTVISTGYRSGYGNTVMIEHDNGLVTLYAHCSSILVRNGEYVSPREKIALIGRTGSATGYHLHFEVRVNGRPVNPLKYISE